MRRFAWFASAFAAGTFAAQYVLRLEWLIPLCIAGAFCAFLCRFFKGRKRFLAALFCTGFSLALFYGAVFFNFVYRPMLALSGTEGAASMTLLEMPQETDWGAKAVVRLDGFPVGKVVYYGKYDLLDLQPGQRIEDTVAFQDAGRIRDSNITTFTSKGVFLLAYSRAEPAYFPGNEASPRWWPQRCAAAMKESISTFFSGDCAGFLTAILTGDTSGLSEAADIHLSEAGLYHILAVSGMHCGYLLAAIIFLVGRHRRRLLAAAAIAVLVFYAFLTGGSPSVVRACLMMGFLLIAPLFGRNYDAPTALFASLFVILLANPYAATSISLQLSFGAMAGILSITPSLYRFLTAERNNHRVTAFLAGSLSATMGALVFTLPLSGYYFGSFSLIAPVSNLLCLLTAGFVFLAGLLVLLTGAFFPSLAALLAVVPKALIAYILAAARFLADVPYHALSFSGPYLKYWLVYVYILFAAVWYFGAKTRRKYAAAAAMAALALVFTIKLGESRYQSGLEVIVLDVGQGECILLKSEDEFALVDCGSANSWQNAGKTAAQQLRAMGCEKLDYLLLTHYDSDHVSGVSTLMTYMETEQLLLPPDEDDAGWKAAIFAAAEERSIEPQIIRGQVHIPFGRTTLTVYPPLGEKEDNERGLSLLAMSGVESVFITGDMSSATEKLLLQTYRIPTVKVLVAGHHGAENATSAEFLQALQPQIVCISVGSNNYGHPADATLRRIGKLGSTVYRTDLHGNIHISLNKGDRHGG